MLIRPATKDDLAICEKLIHIKEMQLANGKYMEKDFLQNYLDDDFFLVAVNDEGTIVGMIFGEEVKGKGTLIWMVAVERNERGKGIGSLLLDAFEYRSNKKGRDRIIAYGYNDRKVMGFYKKHGYDIGTETVECLKIF